MRMLLQQGDLRHVLEVRTEGSWLVLERSGASPLRVELLARDASTLLLRVDGRLSRARYAFDGHDLHVQVEGHGARFHLVDEQEEQDQEAAAGSPVVRAPMPGKILAVLVQLHEPVSAGRPVVRMEAMKMEVDVAASAAGTVASIHVKPGELVGPEAALVTLALGAA
jgi:biotin carboxyl carrier protein